MPKESVCIKKGSDIYILPTNTSTISANTEEKIEKMALDTRGDFIKIEYKEGLIGWVRSEDVCED
jgi:translation elongation factor EF-1alpha